MVPTDVLSRVRDQLAETTAAYWTNAELYRYMTDGEREVNNMFECNVSTTAHTSTTGTSGYTNPDDCLVIYRLTYDGVPLKKLDRNKRGVDALDMPGYGGTGESGNPTHYYELNGTVQLWPNPDASATVGFQFLKDTSALVSGSTAFEVPANHHTPLQDYVLYRAYLKDQDQGKSEWYKREFLQGLADSQRREYQKKWAGGFPQVRDVNSDFTTYDGLV